MLRLKSLARISPVDREYLPTLGQQTYKPVTGYAESTSNISLQERARAINDVIANCEKAGVIGAGFHQARGSATASATKNGNFNYSRSSLVSLSTTARTPDGGSSGYFLRNHFDVAKLDVKRVAQRSDSQGFGVAPAAHFGCGRLSSDSGAPGSG